MSSARFDRVASLFRRAAALDPAARRSFLESACAGDSELLREVLSLLRHDGSIPENLRTGAMGTLLEELKLEQPERIGPYRVGRQLGEGGMGLVFEAEQETPIRRTVAIKLVKGFVGGREAIARLESERQALALMSHPNVARVFDAGATPEGRPFFVMELVTGEPITSYCARHRLGVHERLELFLQVCDGVQHAHHRAIIHRDIKASNVLVSRVDRSLTVKIIDFGVAKVLDQRFEPAGPRTESGQILGTPEYMSPEQAHLGVQTVDTRTDVYSLGVLLYELLAGCLPFRSDESGLEGLLRRIREAAPLRPSVAASGPELKRLRGDLDRITMKALEKEPARRYATPADLAEDISRHLRHQPVLAGTPGVIYRLARLVRRHRTVAALTAALLVTLAGFAIVGGLQAARVAREAERANKEAAEVAGMMDLLLGLFKPRYDGIVDRGASARTLDTLDAAVREARSRLAERPLLLARMLHAMGNSYRARGIVREAEPLLEEAHEGLSRLLGPGDLLTIDAMRSLATLRLDQRRFAEAEGLFLEELAALRRLHGPDHEETLRQESRVGYLYKTWGRNDEAARRLESAARHMEHVLGPNHADTLVTTGFFAGVLLELRRYEEASALLTDLLARMPGALGERHGELVIAHYNLGCAYANLGDRARAFEHLRTSIDRGFTRLGSIAEDPHLEPLKTEPELIVLERRVRLNMANVWLELSVRAEVEIEQGHYDNAERLLVDLIQAIGRLRGPEAHALLAPMLLLGDVHLEKGRFEDAERVLLRNLAISLRNPRSDYFAITHWYLVQCALGRGRRTEAMEHLEASLEGRNGLARREQWKAYAEAVGAAVGGDREGAIRLLTLAADRGYSDSRWLRRDLAFRDLHDDPRFRALLARVSRYDASMAIPGLTAGYPGSR